MSAGPEYGKNGLYERLTRGAPLAVLLAAGLYLAYLLLPVLELMAIAMVIALILRTAINRLSDLGLKPWMSILVLLGVLVAFGAFLWLAVIPNVLNEVLNLISTAPSYLNSLTKMVRQLNSSFSFLPDLSSLSDRLRSYAYEALSSLPTVLTEAGYLAAEAVGVLFLSLYMSISPRSLVNGTLRLVPEERRGGARELIETLKVRLRGWIIGTVIAMLIVGFGVGLGLWAIGIPLALTFGILAGLLELIPYIGQVVAALLPALLALTISPVKALLVILLFLVVNQVDAHIIQPLVMGREVRLHPVAVILAFLAFGELLGFIGVLLAVPAAVFVAVLVDEISPPVDPSEEGTDESAPEKKPRTEIQEAQT